MNLEFKDGRKVDIKYPISLNDDAGNIVYTENYDGSWAKFKYDTNDNCIYHEKCDGAWSKYKFDANGNKTYYENSRGFWTKFEFDATGKETYYENSRGFTRGESIVDTVARYQKAVYSSMGVPPSRMGLGIEKLAGIVNEPVEMTMDDICKALGKNVKVIK